MIKSMTGFGKTECKLSDKTITVEIKTLNSKNLNIAVKLPELYSDKEFEIRKILSDKLERGKINLYIHSVTESETTAKLNRKVIESYYRQLRNITLDLGHEPKDELLFQSILRLPDALKTEENILSDEEWKAVKESINKAIENTDSFRKEEGAAIASDLEEKITATENAVDTIEKYEDERIETIKERLHKKLNEIELPENSDQRFEQEIVYFLEKFDINEEKQRLRQHCKYFKETMQSQSPGKKLNFISQEIGREINTTGSKANHHEIQKIVVEMKDNLEQIKEQLLNTL
jgi:uncharacterized protein (TIGR00255 family)